MNKLILCLIVLSIQISLYSQWTQSFNNLKMYKVKMDGFVNDEQALYFSRIISENENVLIARFYVDTDGYIFSEHEISEELIIENLTKFPNFNFSYITEVIPQTEKYLQVYNDFRRIRFDLSTTLPSPVVFKDKQKEARAYSIFKTLWTEKYSEAYKAMQKEPAPYTQEEINEINQKNK